MNLQDQDYTPVRIPPVHASPERLFEWLEKKMREGVVIELLGDLKSKACLVHLVDIKNLGPTKVFEAPSLFLAVKAAWEDENPVESDPKINRCSHRQPNTGIQCGLSEGHAPHAHSILIPTSASWHPSKQRKENA